MKFFAPILLFFAFLSQASAQKQPYLYFAAAQKIKSAMCGEKFLISTIVVMLTPKEAATYKEEKWEELKPTYDDGIDFRNLQVELVKPDQYAILPVAEEWDCNSTGYRIVIAEDAASAKIKSEALKKDFITTKFSDIKR